jgi:hypothetical protein
MNSGGVNHAMLPVSRRRFCDRARRQRLAAEAVVLENPHPDRSPGVRGESVLPSPAAAGAGLGEGVAITTVVACDA